MSSKIIRGSDHQKKIKVTAGGTGSPTSNLMPQDHVMNVEKQAFEQGYKEGERIGKQMGERMIETAIKRYDRSVQNLATLHNALASSMEKEAVRLALEVAKKIIQREVSMDPDLVFALISVALKRVQGHASITVRVSNADFERVQSAMKAANAAIMVREDASLERGDFILDTVQTHIDGRIGGQIDAIGRALLDE